MTILERSAANINARLGVGPLAFKLFVPADLYLTTDILLETNENKMRFLYCSAPEIYRY